MTLQGRWRGTWTAPQADGELRIEQLQTPGGWAVADLSASLTASAGALAVKATVVQLQIPGANPHFLQNDPLQIDATLGLKEPSRPLHLMAATRLFSLNAQAVTAGRMSAALTVQLKDLRPFAALAAEDLRGTAQIQAQLTATPAGLRVALDASAALDAEAGPGASAAAGARATPSARATPGAGAAPDMSPVGWRNALGNHPTLRLNGTWSDRSVAIEIAQLNGRAIALSLHGAASRAASGAVDAVDFASELDFANLGAWSTALAGTLHASGRLSGPPSALALDAKMSSTLSVRGSPLGTLTGTAQAHGLPDSLAARIQLDGMFDEAPMKLEVELDRDRAGSLRASIREGDWKSAHLQGAVTIGTATAQTRGRLQLHLGELGDLEHLLGMKLQGSADWTGEGATDALNMQLQVQLPELHGTPASLSAAAMLYLDTHTLRLTSLQADYRQQTLHLLTPAAFSFANGLSVDRLQMGMQKATLEFAGRLLPSLDLHASLQEVRPALVNAFMPDLLSDGNLSARADLTGTAGKPIGNIHVEAAGVRFASDAASGLPAVNMRADLQLEADTAKVDAALNAGKNSQLTVSGSAPLDLDGQLALKILGKLDVGLVSPLLEARGLQTAGDLDVDIRVAGTAAAPDIGGTVRLSKGSLRDYVRGINLSGISARFEGSQGALRIVDFTARAASGTVSISGTVGLLEPQIPVDLKISADHAQPVANSLVTANLDAALQIKGTALARLDVTGMVHVNRATIGIPSTLPPSVAVLDVRRRGQKAPPPLDSQLVIGLNFAVQAPNEILVQGRGLDAELGGDLKVGGTVDAPLVSGGFDLQRGSFSIGGNKLTFNAGRVSFDGAGLRSKLDPTLDFTAQAILPEATATLHISGLADAPRFEFSSIPSMSQDEVIALLLFGMPLSQLSTLQMAEIGAALAIMSGAGGDGSFNPLVKIQKTLGLDRLSVGSNTVTTATGTTNSGYNVAAGRYIAKRIYVEAKQSTTGSTQVQVDVDLSKHLKLQTRLGNGTAITQGTTPDNDPGSSVGLSYTIEY
jgi:translocation and assembly module TamB